MDARREQVYNALYKWENGELKEIKEPRALGIDELLEELKDTDENVVFLGDGVPVYLETIKKNLGDRAFISPSSANAQRASSLAPLAKKLFDDGKVINCYELEPVYLRKSQAEAELEKKEANGSNG